MITAARCERFGLRVGPTVAGMAASAGSCPPFDGNEPSTIAKNPSNFSNSGVNVGPVMHAGDGPRDRRRAVRRGQCLRGALDVAHVVGTSGE